MNQSNTKLSDQAVRLDGQEFHNCVFQNCTLSIGGAAPFLLTSCDFIECKWVFVEAAATTLTMMAQLYAGMVPDGKPLIELTLENIRQGSGFGRPFTLPLPNSTGTLDHSEH